MAEMYVMPEGVYTVFVTPFLEDGTIDMRSVDLWVTYQLESDVAGIVLMGTTSEAPTLFKEEQIRLIKHISPKFKGRKCVVIGIGGNNTNETIEFGKECANYADVLMVTVPHYNKPTQGGICQHFAKICSDETLKEKVFMLYNVPGRTGTNMIPKTILKIAHDNKNVVAIKEASGDINQLIDLMALLRKDPNVHLNVFAGDDKLIIDFMAHGGSGVISVASNVFPKFVTDVYSSLRIGSGASGLSLYYNEKFPELCSMLFCESNPIPVKYLLHKIGMFSTYAMRLPLTPLSEEFRKKIDDGIDEYMHWMHTEIVKTTTL